MTAVTIAEESPRQPAVIRLLDCPTPMRIPLSGRSNHLVDLSQLEQAGRILFRRSTDGEIVGCCGLVEAGDGTAEIKRMFIDPEGAEDWQAAHIGLEAKAAKARSDGAPS